MNSHSLQADSIKQNDNILCPVVRFAEWNYRFGADK